MSALYVAVAMYVAYLIGSLSSAIIVCAKLRMSGRREGSLAVTGSPSPPRTTRVGSVHCDDSRRYAASGVPVSNTRASL